MATVFTSLGTFKTTCCCVCGVEFGMPESLYNDRLNDRKWFYCPNGHGQHFNAETEADRLRKQLAREQQIREQVETTRTRLMAERDKLERRLSAQRGASTRLRNRVKHGVCPCCNRTFRQLAAHMADKHPDFKPAE